MISENPFSDVLYSYLFQALEKEALFDSGLASGVLIFTFIGKGKSTPNNNASPCLKTGKNDTER